METFQPDSGLVAQVRPSPNCNARRGEGPGEPRKPDMLVLHYTGVKPDDALAWRTRPGQSALAWLCNPESQVSSHYLVEDNGDIFQLVPESQRAWHAGISSWMGEADLNSASVGVEIVNIGHDGGLPDFPSRQINAVISLCRDIASRWEIEPWRILGHSDIAPGRKFDPGEKFPWDQLYTAGVGHWRDPPPPDFPGGVLRPGEKGPRVAALRQQLAGFGYGLGPGDEYDAETEQVVLAFQRHFRPQKCDGIADASTRVALQNLLAGIRTNS